MGIRGSTVLFSSISVLFLIGFSLVPAADAATFTATQDGDWDDPATWGLAPSEIPPTNTNGHVINIPPGIVVTVPLGVTVTGGGTITNEGDILVVGELDLRSNGVFNNLQTGTVTNTGTASFQGTSSNSGLIDNQETMNTNFGTFTNEANGRITNSKTFSMISGHLINFGRIDNFDALSAQFSSTIDNEATGVINNDGNGTFLQVSGTSSSPLVMQNKGTINNLNQALISVRSDATLINRNDGIIISNGAIGPNGPTASMINEQGGSITIQFPLGRLVTSNGASFENGGRITTFGGVEAFGPITNLPTGIIDVEASGQILVFTSQTFRNEGTVNLNGVTFSPGLEVRSGGIFRNIGGTVNNNSGLIDLQSGSSFFNGNGLVENYSIINLASLFDNTNGTLNNNCGGTINITAGLVTGNPINETCIADECSEGTDNCDPLVTCTDTPESFVCGACPAGYDDEFGDGTSCVDTNECASDVCDPNATCSNTIGSFDCSCNSGYEGDGFVCADIDECSAGLDSCDSLNRECRNEPGSFSCDVCIPGFESPNPTGNDVCTPVASSCADPGISNSNSAVCDGTADGQTCTAFRCDSGFEPSGAAPTCQDGVWQSIPTCDPITFVTCGQGTELNQAGDQCIPEPQCPPGEFESNDQCVLCPAGRYQPASGQDECILADPGNFVPSSGATSQQQCPPGRFSSDAGSIECIPCPTGRYQPASGQSECFLADPGHFADNAGSSSQMECPAGHFSSEAGAAQCILCPEGTIPNPSQTECVDDPTVPLLAQINELEGQVADLEGQLVSCEEQLGALQTENDLLKQMKAQLEAQLAALQAEIDDLFDVLESGEVTICHKGDTLTVSVASFGGHQKHGDTIGACEE